MKVLVKIRRYNVEDMNKIEGNYYKCPILPKMSKFIKTKGNIIIKFKKHWALIPPWLREYKPIFFMEMHEFGGGRESGGYAQIVCGTSGEKLEPYYVNLDKVDAINGKHAWFTMPTKGITIQARTKSEQIIIQYNSLIEEKELGEYTFVWIEQRKEWKGFIENLPHEYNHLKEAVYAAYEKAQDMYCTWSYYSMHKNNIPKKFWKSNLEQVIHETNEDEETDVTSDKEGDENELDTEEDVPMIDEVVDEENQSWEDGESDDDVDDTSDVEESKFQHHNI